MDRALNQLSQMLQEFDCRATLPITTVALARNSRVIKKYQAQGIEFAIHGYRHIDHSQLSLDDQEIRFRKASQVFQREGITCTGFRCPYLRWNDGTITALSRVKLSYDSSNSLVWDVGQKHVTNRYYRALDFYGAQPASKYLATPSLDTKHDIVRIPYCLPDDESLIERLEWRSEAEMDAVWPAMFRQIHADGELFNLGLHPERTADCARGLRATMQAVRSVEAEVWRATLNEIAIWWKARYQATVSTTSFEDDQLVISVNGPPGATLLVRGLTVESRHTQAFDGYLQAQEIPCVVRTTQRPFIGVSPNSSSKLTHFLKQHGYIVETSEEAGHYSLYLDQTWFKPENERHLVSQIESGDFPLVRLGRWPHGARSAFCVTGDIDALTMWDYGLRFVGY
ncbi:MAG: polysaccharide deacetylase family protein [Anaerolineae bacterium]|nr:polysaccharide deacetylase family protein [Anaerolineae bacterium]